MVAKLEVARSMNTQPEPAVAEWVAGLAPKYRSKLHSNGLVSKPVEQAEAEAVRLGQFIDDYMASRPDMKPNTTRNMLVSRGHLVAYFGEARPLGSVTPGDADAYRNALVGKGLAQATVSREVKRARQLFEAARRRRLVSENAFADVKAGKQSNRARDHFVTLADYRAVLDVCPSQEWRCLLALARIGGLRVPSEVVGLRWGDVDWDKGWLFVFSPKLARYPDKAQRRVPLFPELREELAATFEAASEGAEFLLPTIRDADKNLRTQFGRVIERAGLSLWPNLFKNLRASRATELASRHPSHVVAEWLGHSEAIANEHYRQVLDEHYAKAAGERTPELSHQIHPTSFTKNVPQTTAEPSCTEYQETHKALVSQGFMLSGASPFDSVQTDRIPPRGVERSDASYSAKSTCDDTQSAFTKNVPQSEAARVAYDVALAVVVEAWRYLPDSARRQILGVVRESSQAAMSKLGGSERSK
jgi:integrase